jgi:hypothetical protein
MGDLGPGRDEDVLAAKLAEARGRLSELEVPAAEAERLHRQFIAICDATKVPEADKVTGLRRLAAFLSTLEQVALNSPGNKKPN